MSSFTSYVPKCTSYQPQCLIKCALYLAAVAVHGFCSEQRFGDIDGHTYSSLASLASIELRSTLCGSWCSTGTFTLARGRVPCIWLASHYMQRNVVNVQRDRHNWPFLRDSPRIRQMRWLDAWPPSSPLSCTSRQSQQAETGMSNRRASTSARRQTVSLCLTSPRHLPS